MKRRHFTSLLLQSTLAPLVLDKIKLPAINYFAKPFTRLGTTFSPLQCMYLGLDYQEAFKAVCSLGFDTIRLGSYWNGIEWKENQYDFKELDWLLNESSKYNVKLVLTVGMKAPRWPEYHFPDWLKERYDTTIQDRPLDSNPAIAEKTLKFIQAVIEHTKYAPHLKYWQVENEPLTKLEVAAGRFISREFINEEVKLTKQLALPEQKIVLTNAINLPDPDYEHDDPAFQESLNLADAVGINVYTKVPISSDYYLEPSHSYWDKLAEWQKYSKQMGKENWIAEAQAEPWEFQKLVAMDKADYPSTSPKQATELVRHLTQLGYEKIMLWGCEYWYWQKKNGRHGWWNGISQLLQG